MKARNAAFLAGALLLPAAAAAPAQQRSEPTVQQLALAAGYKAQFTCSGIFNGGKTEALIRAQELSNISDDLAPLLGRVGNAQVDRDEQHVSVRYSDHLPPRIAAWRPHLGCTGLPPGATSAAIRHLPQLEFAAPPPNQAELPWPAGDRLPALNASERAAQARLNGTVAAAFAGDFGGVTSAVLIVSGGKVLNERYLPGYTPHTSQRTWSVAKSIAATVIGAAVHRGLLTVDAPTALSAWARPGDPRQAITLEHLLHMNSGLDSGPAGNRTDAVYFGGGLVSQEVPRRRLVSPPGDRWRYANNDTLLALLTLREKIGDRERYLRFPFSALLHPIGMQHTVPETDWDGNFVMSSQVWTTARDLARLGLLYLNDGVWQGKRLLPRGWADYVRTPAAAQPSAPARTTTTPRRGYGAQFWLLDAFPGVGAGAHAALGNRGQLILLQPQDDLVIVRRGYDYSGNRFDGPAFLARVRAAITATEAPSSSGTAAGG
ncbi:MAG: serine hydrolase [Pseudomonadota bacterium]